MATLKRQRARKDYNCGKCKKAIKKGEEYYRFKLTRFSGTPQIRCLTCKPKQSEMTTSDFWAQMYDIQDELAGIGSFEEAQNEVPNIIDSLRTLQEETDDKLQNIPENLQQAPIGELLQGRVDGVEDMIGELEEIDLEPDPDREKWEAEQWEEQILSDIQSVEYCGE